MPSFLPSFAHTKAVRELPSIKNKTHRRRAKQLLSLQSQRPPLGTALLAEGPGGTPPLLLGPRRAALPAAHTKLSVWSPGARPRASTGPLPSLPGAPGGVTPTGEEPPGGAHHVVDVEDDQLVRHRPAGRLSRRGHPRGPLPPRPACCCGAAGGGGHHGAAAAEGRGRRLARGRRRGRERAGGRRGGNGNGERAPPRRR